MLHTPKAHVFTLFATWRSSFDNTLILLNFYNVLYMEKNFKKMIEIPIKFLKNIKYMVHIENSLVWNILQAKCNAYTGPQGECGLVNSNINPVN